MSCNHCGNSSRKLSSSTPELPERRKNQGATACTIYLGGNGEGGGSMVGVVRIEIPVTVNTVLTPEGCASAIVSNQHGGSMVGVVRIEIPVTVNTVLTPEGCASAIVSNQHGGSMVGVVRIEIPVTVNTVLTPDCQRRMCVSYCVNQHVSVHIFIYFRETKSSKVAMVLCLGLFQTILVRY